ncbi:hypothetical protein [Streptomyces synnematoformans]|uniref:Uncharacterized protein n=1 Tax=Streptomyces synnematoformans TaxID=415721 RepID=A0ABP4KFV9_9ACTN
MLLIYSPADSDVERHDIDKLTAVEAGAVESALELPWATVEDNLRENAPMAMLAVLWVFRKRQEPTLRFAGFDVPDFRGSLRVAFSADEVVDLVIEMDQSVPEGHPEREAAFRHLRRLAADESDVDTALEGVGGKDTSSSPAA